MIINMKNVYETVSGRRVEILKLLEQDSHTVVGLIETEDGNWFAHTWSREGFLVGGHAPDYDLRLATYKTGTKVTIIERCWEAVIMASAICPMSKQLHYVVAVTDETAWSDDGHRLTLLASDRIELAT